VKIILFYCHFLKNGKFFIKFNLLSNQEKHFQKICAVIEIFWFNATQFNKYDLGLTKLFRIYIKLGKFLQSINFSIL